jgi:hypothetical protein
MGPSFSRLELRAVDNHIFAASEKGIVLDIHAETKRAETQLGEIKVVGTKLVGTKVAGRRALQVEVEGRSVGPPLRQQKSLGQYKFLTWMLKKWWIRLR